MNDHVAWGLIKKLRAEYDYQIGSILGRLLLLEVILQVKIAVDVVLADFRLANYSGYAAVQIRADAFGQSGYFVKVASGGPDDGTNFIIDSVGTVFERRRLV